MKYTVKDLEDQINTIEQKINDPELCKGTAETYSRISGYYRSVSQWNNGKRFGEYPSRVNYVVN
jgi:anaerobic ribonucleoside-triphosphate reductase